MSMQYRIAAEGGVRDVDDAKRQVLVSFPWEVVDSYKTDFSRSAFDDYLNATKPIMCWQHQRTEPIGRVREWTKTDTANEFVAGFSDFDAVPRAHQAFAQIRDGELTDFSYGFDQAQSMAHPSTRGAIRFTKARMPEISPVSVGSIPGAVAVGIRAEAEVANIRGLVEAGAIDEAEAEEMMRAAGVGQPVVTITAEPEPQRETITIGSPEFAAAVRAAMAEQAPEPEADPGTRDDDAVTTLASAVDAALDQAAVLIGAEDTSGLSANLRQALDLVDSAGVAADALLDEMGIDDPDDTDDGGRSAEAPTEPEGERATVSNKPWSDFSQADYSDAQWKAACLITGPTKADCKLPVREPDGTLNSNGVHAAAGRLGQTDASPADKTAAAKALMAAYHTIGDHKVPPSVLALASGKREDDAELLDVEAEAALALLGQRFAS
jgi:HK97 family phage prohead protease